MDLINWNALFEPQGARFIYRPNNFSAGYLVTAEEKERLIGGIKGMQKRLFLEAFFAIALFAVVLLIGLARTETVRIDTVVPWFTLLSVAVVALLALVASRRMRHLIRATLGDRVAEVPRLSLRQAVNKPRPGLHKRYSLPMLRGLVPLFVVAAAVIDGLALVPIIAALWSRRSATSAADFDAIDRMLSLTLYNPVYWLLVVGLTAILLFCAFLLRSEVRRIGKLPD